MICACVGFGTMLTTDSCAGMMDDVDFMVVC
jgi:hypothetical protein